MQSFKYDELGYSFKYLLHSLSALSYPLCKKIFVSCSFISLISFSEISFWNDNNISSDVSKALAIGDSSEISGVEFPLSLS